MRIVYVIERFSEVGGLERVLAEKMNYIAEHTVHEVVLMTLWRDSKPVAYALSPKIQCVNLDVHRPPIPMGYVLMLPVVICRYNRAMRDLRPDVCVLQRAMGAFLAVFVRHTCKTVFEGHTIRHQSNHRWLYPRMERNVSVVVALTRGDASEYTAARNVTIIPNSCHLAPYGDVPVYKGKHCVSIARFVPGKGHLRMLHIWRKVVDADPECILDIYGDGPERKRVEENIRKLNLGDNVVLHGITHDVAETYRKARVAILASEHESFGLCIVEAMACGVPTVAFDCPYGPASIITDGEDGMLVPYEDDEAMVDSLLLLMRDDNLCRMMGREGLSTVQAYQPETVMQRWVEFFERLG